MLAVYTVMNVFGDVSEHLRPIVTTMVLVCNFLHSKVLCCRLVMIFAEHLGSDRCRNAQFLPFGAVSDEQSL